MLIVFAIGCMKGGVERADEASERVQLPHGGVRAVRRLDALQGPGGAPAALLTSAN
jgi:hypothetical protein